MEQQQPPLNARFYCLPKQSSPQLDKGQYFNGQKSRSGIEDQRSANDADNAAANSSCKPLLQKQEYLVLNSISACDISKIHCYGLGVNEFHVRPWQFPCGARNRSSTYPLEAKANLNVGSTLPSLLILTSSSARILSIRASVRGGDTYLCIALPCLALQTVTR